jgi:hypothetical protein
VEESTTFRHWRGGGFRRGATWTGIANSMNDESVPTGQTGRCWHPATVRRRRVSEMNERKVFGSVVWQCSKLTSRPGYGRLAMRFSCTVPALGR